MISVVCSYVAVPCFFGIKLHQADRTFLTLMWLLNIWSISLFRLYSQCLNCIEKKFIMRGSILGHKKGMCFSHEFYLVIEPILVLELAQFTSMFIRICEKLVCETPALIPIKSPFCSPHSLVLVWNVRLLRLHTPQ